MTPPTPDLPFWGGLLVTLACEIGVAIGLAALVAPRLAVAGHRRLIWLAAVLAVPCLVAGELSGLAHRVSFLAAPPPAPPSASAPHAAIVVSGRVDIDAAETEAFTEAPPRSSTPPKPPVSEPSPAWWPGMVWIAGALGWLALRGIGHALLVLKQRHRSRPQVEPELRLRLDRLAERLQLPRVGLRYWPEIRGPVAYGVLRPSIALPPDFVRRFDSRQRDAILLHELAHLAARDPLALVLADLACAVAWWHPAVHWARRRLQAAMEAAADEASTLVPDGRTALAESLVRLARELATPDPARGLGVAGASNRSQLAGRVEALLAGSRDWRRTSGLARCVTWASATFVALALMVPAWPGRADASLSHLLLAATSPTRPTAAPVPEAGVPEPASDTLSATQPAVPGDASATPTAPASGQTPSLGPKIFEVSGAFPPDAETAEVQEKLDRFVLASVYFPNTPLSEVVRELRRLSAEVDPEKFGIWFHLVAITGDPEDPIRGIVAADDYRIRMKEPLRDASVRRVLDAIVAASETPITYEADGYGVSFRPRRPEAVRLITRVYRLNVPAFLQGTLLADRPDAAAEPPRVIPLDTHDSGSALGRWLENAGISVVPPNGFFFKPSRGLLMTRATEAEQAKLEKLLAPYAYRRDPPPEALLADPVHPPVSAVIGVAPPPAAPTDHKPAVVTLEIKVLEITDRADTADLGFDWLFGQTTVQPDPVRVERPAAGDPAAGSPHADAFRIEKTQVEGQAAVVSEAQWKALQKVLDSRGGVTLLATPKIKTFDGLAGEIQIQDSRSIVTAVDTNGPTSPHVSYHTEVLGFGPRVRIVPSRRSDSWHLALFGGVSEFLGYDKPATNLVVQGTDGPLSAQIPLPRLRVRQLVGEGTLRAGQSLLVRGPVTEQIERTRRGWFRSARTEVRYRRLYLLVTPINGA